MNFDFRKKVINLAKKLIVFQLFIGLIAGFLMPLSPAQASNEPLKISNIVITHTDKTATITWRTNRPAYGTVNYGLYSNDYHWRLNTNKKDTVQTMTISGLFPETTYFIQIIADDETSEVLSFEQNFETSKPGKNKSPKISDVQVVYLTGHTATIQWYTDEKATSEVEYGMTEKYGKTAKDGRLTKIHDLTIKGLTDGTQYHFRVKSKDEDRNITRWHDMIFRTKLTSRTDKDELIIYSIKPSSENDLNVSETTAVISWRTNKLSEGWVRYGTSLSYGKTVYTNPPRDFANSITLTDLAPGTVYYFEIGAKDVFNKKTSAKGHSFTTKTTASADNYQPDHDGKILGASTLDVDLKTDFGFYGIYYNLTKNMPGMELYKGKYIPNSKVAAENYWYDDKYFAFERVDNNLNFGTKFFPVNEGKPGDPYHFAIIWRAIINVPQDGSYSYSVTSDDDSWVFVDDKITSDLNGVHPAKTDKQSIYLTEGYHKLEIYFAERSRKGSTFKFIPDSKLKFHPLPTGYEVEDVLEYNQWLNGTGGPAPAVLGVKVVEIPKPTSNYVCKPNLGYTRFKALYKTQASPDVWAILETGQKHYISSPGAFDKYQCGWGEVKTVSQKTLDNYPNANLVRTPSDPAVYHLFQRPDRKWLKINIPSPTVFVSYSNNYWGNIARVDILDIQAYPDAKLIKTANDSKVYLLENDQKRLISSDAVFINRGYDFAEVAGLSQIHLDSYKNGSSVD